VKLHERTAGARDLDGLFEISNSFGVAKGHA